MQTPISDVAITLSNSALDLATWNIERSTDQLVSFINAKHAALPLDIEL